MITTTIPVTRAEHYVPEDEAYLPSPTEPAARTLRDDAGCVAMGSTHLSVSFEVVEPGTVTLAAHPAISGGSYYEFDLTPWSARVLAHELLRAATAAQGPAPSTNAVLQ